MHLNEETIKSETVFEGKILYVTRDVAKLENGREVIRDVIHHNGGVCVVPLTEQGQVLMVRQFRYPHHCVTLEVPAGKLEQGEEPLTCGIRELWEETGARAESMEYLGSLFPTPAYDTEVIHMYLAKGLQVGGSQKLDPDEFVDVERIDLREAVNMVLRNEIQDAKTQIALMKTYLLEQQKKQGMYTFPAEIQNGLYKGIGIVGGFFCFQQC